MALRTRSRRRKWDEQPTAPCAVLLAADGREDFSARSVALAAERAGDGPVAVATIARIHGTQFGLPNPGLLPTKQELAERDSWVEAAIRALRRAGVEADGQIASTRKPTKTLARIARVRGVGCVVIDETRYTGWRRFVEGDVGAELAKRLRRDGIEVVVVPREAP